MKKFITLIAAGLPVLLSSCVGDLLQPKNDPTQFYMLRSSPDTAPMTALNNVSINMPLVRIPAYMTRTQIVSAQPNSTRVNISDIHRWAEIPSDSFTREIAGNLGRLLSVNVAVYPSVSNNDNAIELRITVVECLGEIGGDLNFAASWEANSDAHYRGGFFKTKIPAGRDYGEYTKAISKALDELSADLAKNISQ